MRNSNVKIHHNASCGATSPGHNPRGEPLGEIYEPLGEFYEALNPLKPRRMNPTGSLKTKYYLVQTLKRFKRDS